MKSGMNLNKKAILIVSGILFFIIAINTGVLTYVATEKYKKAILSKTTAVGEALQRDFGKVIGLGVPIESLDGVNEKMKEFVARDKAIGYATLLDKEGKVLFADEEANIGKTMKDPATARALSSDQVLQQTAGAFYDISFPLLNAEGKTAGIFRVGVKLAAIRAQLYTLLLSALGISLLCLVISIVLVYVSISKFITRPILEMEKTADRIASGDLTAVIDVKGDDEVALLGMAINRMALNLKDMLSKIGGITGSVSEVTANIASSSQSILSIADVQKKEVEKTAGAMEQVDESISQVVASTGSLSESAGDTSSAILEMTASIERIAENANVFSETAHDTASSIEEMLSSIKQIAGSIDNLSTSAEQIASSIDEVGATTRDIEHRAGDSVGLAEAVMINASDKGLQAANAALSGMENIKKSVVALSDVINMLGKRTDDIGKILTVIDDVADQTNLLALNAAILASKAGEHGKGFSIVADEIKNLAERASVSTNEIASLIKSVQDVTRSSIMMANEGIHTVEKGLLLVKDVNGALEEIVESSKASTEMAKAIQRATAEESQVLKQITDAVEVMTEQTETISRAIQEQSKGSQFIVEASERVKDLSSQVKLATGEQKDGSRQIGIVIENVSRQAAQIAAATGKQKEKSVAIVESMDKIHSTSDNLIRSGNEMNTVIKALKEESVHLLAELKKFKV
ncbi:MAG: methyl-accepting chemotaxis protein [Nitrospiraceae bacterium]|nr:methyl-accepting chemotaxis protein [Nitrospiraceae bacterium]